MKDVTDKCKQKIKGATLCMRSKWACAIIGTIAPPAISAHGASKTLNYNKM